jgi:hypothetical protein
MLVASEPKQSDSPTDPFRPNVKYCLHHRDADATIQDGAQVVSLDHVCPPFKSTKTGNVFGHLFGVEFSENDMALCAANLTL